MAKFNLATIAQRLGTEADAYEFLEELRWAGTPVCPHCDGTKAYFLKPSNGASRKTRTGSMSERRVWKCATCRKQFSVLTGTIFHGSKIPVRTWVMVFFEMVCSKNGVAAREIERKYGVTAKSAWFMTHRIREAMKQEPLADMMRGAIVADETFVGGKKKNQHRQGRYGNRAERGPGGAGHLQPVLTLVNRTTGEARSRLVPDVTGNTLRKAIAEQVDMANSTLDTDAGTQYRDLGQEFMAHQWVDHSRYEYVRDTVTSNQAENFFSQLKRSIDGTHHHVSREHLHRYLAEFDYRFSTREMDDAQRMARLLGRVAGKRLTYRVSLAAGRTASA